MNWYGLAKLASQNQKGWTDNFGDVQRYMLDAYQCSVYKTKTTAKVTISVTVAHMQYGHIMWQTFWVYPLKDNDIAERTFVEVKERSKLVFDQFVGDETPTNLLHSYLREALRDIDTEHQPVARIPWINHAKNEKGVSDWRSSIYGTRYPGEHVDGF